MATQAELDALDAIRVTGVQRVTVADRTVEYRSIAEIDTVRGDLKSEIAVAAGALAVRQVHVVVDRGF